MINDGTPEYRFAPPGPRDEPKVVGECAWCGGAIYEGDEVAYVSEVEKIVHEECEVPLLQREFVVTRGIIGADGVVE
ncbi:hypothetical protein ACFQ3Y_09175 [Paenibacillus motobuensis]|uniref:hypothetical protein n=1 Tax=Paenibacillus motobuensis TaxID=295324 RepID=UPI00362D6CC5